MSTDQLVERPAEHAEIQRLPEELDDPQLECSPGLLDGGLTGHQDRRQRPDLLADEPEHLHAVEAGEVKVEEREVDLDAARELDGVVAPRGGVNEEAALPQQLEEHVAKRIVVFDK